MGAILLKNYLSQQRRYLYHWRPMTWGDSKRHKEKNTKQGWCKHIIRCRIMWVSYDDRSYMPCDNLVINKGITISMKNVSYHATRWNIVFANNVVVSTIKHTKHKFQWRLLIVLFYQFVFSVACLVLETVH